MGIYSALDYIKKRGLGANVPITSPIGRSTATTINATATVTAAQLKTGLLTSTSAAAVTMTLPTATLMGAAINAVRGTTFDFYVDNTAGATFASAEIT